MDWFLYDNGLRHERVNLFLNFRKFEPQYSYKLYSYKKVCNLMISRHISPSRQILPDKLY